MTRRDQVNIVARVSGITPAQARLALDAVAGLVRAGLLEERKCSLLGIGTFVVDHRSARRVRHPATGIIMDLPPVAGIKFRPTSELRESVEERHTHERAHPSPN